MKIGILGSGDVAQALGTGLLRHGHEVTLGTRSPDKLKGWQAHNDGGHAASFADAAKSGEVVVLAVKGTAASAALGAAGAANLAGKTVIDATNPIADAPPVNGVLRFFTSHRRVVDGTPAARVPGRSLGQGVQLGRQRLDGRPGLPGRQADDVHLRQRRGRQGGGREARRSARLGDGGHGQRRGSARDRAACACCGASPDCCTTSGVTRSSCSGRHDQCPSFCRRAALSGFSARPRSHTLRASSPLPCCS